jgi:hypothetical protein
MARPGGVTFLAILEFIGAGICVLLGLLTIAGAGLIHSLTVQNQGAQAGGMASLFAVLGGALSIFFFVLAAIAILLGIGLWTLKNWARIIVIIFAAIGILMNLSQLLHFTQAIIPGLVIGLAIDGLIIWYMLKPNVAAAFAEGQARSAGA